MQLAKALVQKQLGYGKPKERTIAMEEADEQEISTIHKIHYPKQSWLRS